ncbi:Wee1 kinase [Chlorella sorokiniana]|uniref:Wee1 kinase n=1 Tax=Chlorella sorokiniana TaxID=3076 RepID=A0A2P6U3R9_CHLSO|nr:Wee1 kinase [Chlorella sorokiniana]|eukprot:PRW60946.1 Wee1 kinase [Chlorella sorokiniana]
MLSFAGCSQPSQGPAGGPASQLGAGFTKMSISSQSTQPGGSGAAAGEKPPVPLFAEGPPVSSQQLPLPPAGHQPLPPLEIPLSQTDFLGTQDFITPVDQFNLDYDPKDAKRSPARLTPNRVKRPRPGASSGGSSADASMEEAEAGPSGRGAAFGGPLPRRIARLQSPPCYRNIFVEGDSEEAYASWKAPRPAAQHLTRYRQDFKEVGLLGQGNFSKVFRVRHRFDGREYAVKRTQREARPDCPAFAQFIQEAQVLAHLPPHPNVVQYYCCWSEAAGELGEHLYIQLEKCDVNLGIHASLGEQLREGDLLDVLEQMASALAHLHKHGVAHLDVKPDNIYLQDAPEVESSSSSGGGATPPVRYKLGDFGQATRLDLRTPVSVDEGDCRYQPPELLRGELGQLHKADMFALGASLLELATRTELPTGGQQYQDLRAGKLPMLPTFTQRFTAMIKALMAPKPEDRPSAEKVLASSLLAGRRAGSPKAAQPLAHQTSTASTQSATTVDGAAAASSTVNSSSSSRDELAAAIRVQLQAEAVHLLVSLVGSSKARLPAQSACQLLQALPQLCPQASKAELAMAVAAVAAVLGQQQSRSREESAPTTRLLCKLLRALQVLLVEAKSDHGANAATLAAALQQLFTYGTQGESVAAPTASRSSLHLESSDSESSDAEGGGERHHASRVRSAALACLQLLVKADSKSLHGSWTVLLPTSDPVASRYPRGGSPSVAHLLLHDPQLRVRHAAAATITTLLEGPAQRAYLAVADARELDRQPVRGFITLSASLGQMLVALHSALLHSTQSERDPLVLAATLRALGTLLLGAPYHRLPPQLLPRCVQALLGCLAKATPAPPAGPAGVAADQLPVVSACLSCLAAAFSSKAPGAPIVQEVTPAAGASDVGGEQHQLLQLLFGYAACPHATLQLEAVMALRGVAQQHAALLDGHWERLLAIASTGARLPAPQPSHKSQGADGTLPEKVAQQNVRLAGDYLAGSVAAVAQLGASTTLDAGAEIEQWQQVAEQVLQPATQHASPLLRAAAQAIIGALSPAVLAGLPLALQQQQLAWCCNAVATDDASPVRAAAAKAAGALANAPGLCAMPEGPEQLLAALTAGSRDAVLAVRLPAAASLATLCSMLSGSTAGDPAVAAAAQRVFPDCLRLALAAAAGDNDKLRPSGLQALGSLAALADVLPPTAVASQEQQLEDAVAAVSSRLAARSVRVQWAACEAAGALLACGAAPVLQHCAALVQQLLGLLRECPNFRSRTQAAGALLRLRCWGALGGDGCKAVQLLDDVATVLFRGKANDFCVPAPPAAAATGRSESQLASRQEPGELGSKAQLEAALAAAMLHLLSLLPLAEGVPAGSSTQLPQLRALVRQAQQELLPPAAPAADEAAQRAGVAAALYFDLSQVSPQQIPSAAEGMALL